MSNRYKGGVISATPPTLVAGAGASGAWTLEQQMQAIAAGLWPVNGPFYIEDVFSTYLYTGTGSAQTITNGIDLSTNGGLVWIKGRNNGWNNILQDTNRGINSSLCTNNTDGAINPAGVYLTSFNSNGFSIGTNGSVNFNTNTYVSWTFREQPKFFDVVTFTKSSSPQTISHNLGSTPGCIFIKRTDSTGAWLVAHRGYSGGITAGYTLLNTTDAFTSNANAVTAADSTSFTLGSAVVSGDFVAYLFAHNAGGFGLNGTDNVISCGSFSCAGGANATINLGYEPQWVLFKDYGADGNWQIADTMRGFPAYPKFGSALYPNLTATDSANQIGINLTSTGFESVQGQLNGNFIYIAIRRGPMKVPTSGTSVFTPVQNSNFTAGVVIAGQPTVDMVFNRQKDASNYTRLFDRLRGSYGSTNPVLYTNTTDAEANTAIWALDQQNGVRITQTVGTYNYVNYLFSRAPSFFDEVCYTGTGSATTFTHNLGVAPELMIVKCRSSASTDWKVYSSSLGNNKQVYLNYDYAVDTPTSTWNNTTPTASVFSVGGSGLDVNNSGETYVAYLFATCAGVSKVGSYTGTGTTKQIDCGFTGGARFVLIKRTDSTGDWYYWDSSRGIVAGNDPYLLINSFSAEVTNTDYVDTYSAGFEISNTAPAAINANGGTFIFLAIA